MRKIVVLLCSLVISTSLSAQLPLDFDECVDLMSVVWRLAGADEYQRCSVTPYIEEVDRYFSPFAEHPAVQLAKKYSNNNVGYDAVAVYGAHLDVDGNGNVVFDDTLIRDFDSRWSESMQFEFLETLNSFYKESDFRKWFDSTKQVREESIQAFSAISSSIDMDWYGRFFNPDGADFRITLCILAGQNNYGVSLKTKDGKFLLSPVISCASYGDGKISYDANMVLPIVVHEFCHAYCNSLIDANWNEISDMAGELYKLNRKTLVRQAYSSPVIMMYETFVRSCVIRYMIDHFREKVSVGALIKEEEDRGFSLARTMVEKLTGYEREKEKYPRMESFMPELVNAINCFDVSGYKKTMREAKRNRIHYTCNIRNGSKNIPAGEFTVKIKFDRPMTGSVALAMTEKDFPRFKDYSWSDDMRTLSIIFLFEEKHPYGFFINGDGFRSKDGYASISKKINFSTR